MDIFMLRRSLTVSFLTILFFPAIARADFAGGIYIAAICDIMDLMHGEMGGFLFSSALVVGVIAAAFGSFSQIKTSVAVAVGSFAIASVLSMHTAFADISCNAAPAGREVNATEARQPTAAQRIISESDSPVALILPSQRKRKSRSSRLTEFISIGCLSRTAISVISDKPALIRPAFIRRHLQH